ncbi:hypothetical protein N3K66_008026 [Trichothecium roseum]|uniref:Uncharacterized protein n=1 Tax=Trichothecium roseum TaxID=47278 RepID=A0ACC0US82_9HYPO|nr:hypothetical protein N3K66_008026 [Trichothecium roseum]
MLTLACGHALRLTVLPVLPPGSHADQTCSYCTPELRLRILRSAYENNHGLLVRRYREARARGDGAGAARVEEEVKEAVRTFREAVSMVPSPSSSADASSSAEHVKSGALHSK